MVIDQQTLNTVIDEYLNGIKQPCTPNNICETCKVGNSLRKTALIRFENCMMVNKDFEIASVFIIGLMFFQIGMKYANAKKEPEKLNA